MATTEKLEVRATLDRPTPDDVDELQVDLEQALTDVFNDAGYDADVEITGWIGEVEGGR